MLFANFPEYLVVADLIPFVAEDKEWVRGKRSQRVPVVRVTNHGNCR